MISIMIVALREGRYNLAIHVLETTYINIAQKSDSCGMLFT